MVCCSMSLSMLRGRPLWCEGWWCSMFDVWCSWRLMMFVTVDDVWCSMTVDDVWCSWRLMMFDVRWRLMFNDVRWRLMFNDVQWCSMTVDVWWCLMFDVRWRLMMFDDGWWCLMFDVRWCLMFDVRCSMFDDGWCSMTVDDVWWCLMFVTVDVRRCDQSDASHTDTVSKNKLNNEKIETISPLRVKWKRHAYTNGVGDSVGSSWEVKRSRSIKITIVITPIINIMENITASWFDRNRWNIFWLWLKCYKTTFKRKMSLIWRKLFVICYDSRNAFDCYGLTFDVWTVGCFRVVNNPTRCFDIVIWCVWL